MTRTNAAVQGLRTAVAAAAALVLWAAPARALGPSPVEGRVITPEASVLAFLHAANRMEVKMGRLAEDRGFSPAVKQYAAMLIRDHRRADRKVLAETVRLGLDLPYVPTGETPAQRRLHRLTMSRLNVLTGREFDRVYLRAMVDDHRGAITRVVEARNQVTDPRVRDLIDATLPVLRHHLVEAKQILGGLMVSPR
jgi:putative membrane protein